VTEQPEPVDTKEPEKDPEAGPPPTEGENQDTGETPIPDRDDDPEA